MPENSEVRNAYVSIIKEMAAIAEKRGEVSSATELKKGIKEVCKTPQTMQAASFLFDNLESLLVKMDGQTVIGTLAYLEEGFAFLKALSNVTLTELAKSQRKTSTGEVTVEEVKTYAERKVQAKKFRDVLEMLGEKNLPPIPEMRAPWGMGTQSQGKEVGKPGRKPTTKQIVYHFDSNEVEGMRLHLALFGNTKGWGGSGIGGRVTLSDIGMSETVPDTFTREFNGHRIWVTEVVRETED